MSTFVIDSENSISVFAAGESVPDTSGSEKFGSIDELEQLTEGWPASRLVEVWNGIPGFTPVKKFTNRKIAVGRIWKAIQNLNDGAGPRPAHVAPEPARSGKKATNAKRGTRRKSAAHKAGRKAKSANTVREGTKTERILGLLRQSNGATLNELMKATGWQAHSMRGFLSGVIAKKMRLSVQAVKREDGCRVYKLHR